jgi:hypothetical protein
MVYGQLATWFVWFAKTDGSGPVFLMNVTDTAEAHEMLEALLWLPERRPQRHFGMHAAGNIFSRVKLTS